jgi:hypothetical protein
MSVPVGVLYIASFVATGLLATFARQNWAGGWVRQRTSVVADLIELQRNYDAADETRAALQLSETAQARLVAPKPVSSWPSQYEEAEFTMQLVRLQSGSGTSTITPAEQKTETVPVSSGI